jgi:hypothetical protein
MNNQANDEEEIPDEALENSHGNDQNNNHGTNQTEDLGDTTHSDDITTTALVTSIELVKQNRPLLDRLGKFGKVLENLLQIGTAVGQVNSPSSSLIKKVSDHSVG